MTTRDEISRVVRKSAAEWAQYFGGPDQADFIADALVTYLNELRLRNTTPNIAPNGAPPAEGT